jgi:hypothetical protein
MPRKKKKFTAADRRQMEPESVAVQRLLAAGTMPWLTSGPPWISGLSNRKMQTYAVKHYQATAHGINYTHRGAECSACAFKVFEVE